MATDYVFEKPTDEDFDAIVQFLLDDFLVREPLLSSLGATREEELPLFTGEWGVVLMASAVLTLSGVIPSDPDANVKS